MADDWTTPQDIGATKMKDDDGWNDGAATGAEGWNDSKPSTGTFKAKADDEDPDLSTLNFAEAIGADENAQGDQACRNCGKDGHFARDCPEPRKLGACFNCGEEGHSKTDCTNPRKFKGECRNCNQEGHMADDCPTRVVTCKNCQQEGHTALECTNLRTLSNDHIADKSEEEAWALLAEASAERDIGDFKDALQVLSKTCPDYTYPKLEREFRGRGFTIFLIAMEKDHGDTYTNVNLQGEIGKKYAVSYFTSATCHRPALVDKWPASPEENLKRLADAGVPMDRGVDKCNNCGKVGHSTRRCPDEKMAPVQPKVTCFLCGEEGHRVRDCTQSRKREGGRACKICESEEHLAKDCPNREKRACRNCGEEDHMAKDCPTREKRTCHNCGEEDHMAKDCTNPRKVTCNICSEEGHYARECPKKDEPGARPPRDYSKVTCNVCGEKGHTRVRCPQAQAEDTTNGGGNNKSVDAPASLGEGWDAVPTANGSGPMAAWETAPANDEYAAAPVTTGGW